MKRLFLLSMALVGGGQAWADIDNPNFRNTGGASALCLQDDNYIYNMNGFRYELLSITQEGDNVVLLLGANFYGCVVDPLPPQRGPRPPASNEAALVFEKDSWIKSAIHIAAPFTPNVEAPHLPWQATLTVPLAPVLDNDLLPLPNGTFANSWAEYVAGATVPAELYIYLGTRRGTYSGTARDLDQSQGTYLLTFEVNRYGSATGRGKVVQANFERLR